MTVDEFVAERSKIATQHKADRVISSPLEVPAIRAAVTRPDFIVVTPGTRPVGSANNDQKRVATPAAAIAGGADYLIVGRPIVKTEDPQQATLSQSEPKCRQRSINGHSLSVFAIYYRP
jgi:orotidine-5'-phosphate decarboxylase